MPPRLLAFPPALVLLCSCATASFRPLHAAPRPLPPRPASSVEVLTLSPGRPFLEVGVVDPGNFAATQQRVVEIAAAHGCDAVVIPEDAGDMVPCIVYAQP